MTEEQKKSKINLWMISTVLLIGLIVGFGAAQFAGFDFGKKAAKTSVSDETEKTPSLSEKELAKVLPDDDPFIGDKDAAVTIVEFSDFQCPFCGASAGVDNKITKGAIARLKQFNPNWQAPLPKLLENYINTGKVKLVYRDFPLGFHKWAQSAAQASQCAFEQGKFKEMHDKIFFGSESWALDDSQDGVKVFKDFAKEIGLDAEKFNECLDSGKYRQEVQKDMADGIKYGVEGTPTFFVNGKILRGAGSYEEFVEMIDGLLQ